MTESIFYRRTREPVELKPYLTLGEIIARLEQEDPARLLPLGFANPHSYRGDYFELAFEPVRDVTVGEVLAEARFAVGATFQGWKGGDYTMNELSDCWISEHGASSDNKIGPLLLDLLLACPTCRSLTRDGDMKAGRNAIDRGDGAEWCDDEWHDQGGDPEPAHPTP